MGTKYTTILVGGEVATYNDNPPDDDGSQTEANRVKFATITSDLTAPLHSAITSMDAKLLLQVNEGPLTKSGAFTTTATEHNKVIECSGTIAITLLDPSGNAGYQTTIKNAGAGVVTIDVDGGANIDGAASIELGAGDSRKVYVNAAGTAYFSVAGLDGEVDSGGNKLAMLFYNDLAPVGWTIVAAVDEHALRLTKGSVAGGQAGGAIGGTNSFSAQFVNLNSATEAAHTHGVSITSGGPSSTATPESGGGDTVASQNHTHAITGNTGVGSAHLHVVDLRVKWAACIIADKD